MMHTLTRILFTAILAIPSAMAQVDIEVWMGRPGPMDAALRLMNEQAADESYRASGFDLGQRVVRSDPHVMRATADLVAPASGDFRFWFAGDVFARLSLHDGSGEIRQLIDVGPGSRPGVWDRHVEQRSSPVALEKGRQYKLVLQTFRDWPEKRPIQIAWETPGGERSIIRANDLVSRPEKPTGKAMVPDLLLATTDSGATADPLHNDPDHQGRVRLASVAGSSLGTISIRDGLLAFEASSAPGRELLDVAFDHGLASELEVVVSPPLDAATARKAILEGVHTVGGEFTGGVSLLPMARESALLFPLKQDNSQGSARGTIAISRFGKGRIVVVPLASMRDDRAVANGDGGKLWTSLIRWARGGNGNAAVSSRDNVITRLHQGRFLITAAGGEWRETLDSASVLILDPDDFASVDHEAILDAVGRRGMGLVVATASRMDEGATLAWRVAILPGDRTQGSFDAAGINSDFVGARLAAPFTHVTAFDRAWHDSEQAAQDIQAIRNATRRAFSPADAQFRPTATFLQRHNASIGLNPMRGNRVTGRLCRLLLDMEGVAISDLPQHLITAHRSSMSPGGMEYLPPDAPREASVEVKLDTGLTGFVPLGGLHAPAGEKVTIRVPESIVDTDWKILVGCQRWGFGGGLQRMAHMQWEYPIESANVEIIHPYGGLLYLWNPKEGRPSPAESGMVPFTVTASYVVRAPFFVLGVTDPNEWRDKIRHHPGPRTELWGPWFAATLPSEMIRDLEDPTPALQHFNNLMKSYDEIGGFPELRRGPEYASYDIETGAWAGYPFHGYDGWVVGQIKWDEAARCIYADAGTVHELSHSAQIRPNHTWRRNPYTKDWETTITIFDAQAKHHYPRQIRAGWGQIRFHMDQAMRDVMNEAQQTGQVKTHGGYGLWPRGEGKMYVLLRHIFPDEVWHRFFHSYSHDEIHHPERIPRHDSQKADQWLTRFSEAAGVDMRRFFLDIMRLEVSTAADAKVASMRLPVFLPAVGGVSEAATMSDTPLLIELDKEVLSFDGIGNVSRVEVTEGGTIERTLNGMWLFIPATGFTGVANAKYTTTSSTGFEITNPLSIHVVTAGVGIDIHPFSEPLATPDQLDSTAPLRTGFWSDVSIPWNLGSGYTARIRGTILPDRSGQHEFKIVHREACAVWIWPVGESRPTEPTFRNTREWRGPDRERGETLLLNLTETQEYHIEAIVSFHSRHDRPPGRLLPNGFNDDYFVLYWQPPGTCGPRPITSENLAPVRTDTTLQSLPTQSHKR